MNTFSERATKKIDEIYEITGKKPDKIYVEEEDWNSFIKDWTDGVYPNSTLSNTFRGVNVVLYKK